MTKIVYWAPWYPNENRKDLSLLYDEPDSLLTDITKKRNKENTNSNWYRCHAMLNHASNTFILRFPFTYSFAIHKDFGIVNTKQQVDETIEYISLREPSVKNAQTISLFNNWIFWCDEPLKITSTPSYMHPASFGGYYVPGSFDINSWFRPLEAALQLNEGVDRFDVQRGDPFAYVKFHTDEPVILKRFYLTNEIAQLSFACINYKFNDPSRPLSYLYSKFKKHGLQRAISEAIQKNILDK